MFYVEVTDDVTRLEPESWDDCVHRGGGSMFQYSDWLRAYIAAPPSRLSRARFVEVRRAINDATVAVMPLFHLSSEPHFTSARGEFNIDHPCLDAPQLLSHSWYAYNCEPTINAGAVEVNGIADMLLDVVEETAREWSSTLVGFPALPADSRLRDNLERRGYRPYALQVNAVMARSPYSTPSTLQANVTPSRRRDLARLRRRADLHGLRLRTDNPPELFPLFAILADDANVARGLTPSYPLDFLRAVQEQLAHHLVCLSVWEGDQLAGAMICVHRDMTLTAWIAALDYSSHRRLGTYSLLYSMLFEWATTHDIARIEGGRGLVEMKATLGFMPQPMTSWFAPPATPEQHAAHDFLVGLHARIDIATQLRTVRRPEAVDAQS